MIKWVSINEFIDEPKAEPKRVRNVAILYKWYMRSNKEKEIIAKGYTNKEMEELKEKCTQLNCATKENDLWYYTVVVEREII